MGKHVKDEGRRRVMGGLTGAAALGMVGCASSPMPAPPPSPPPLPVQPPRPDPVRRAGIEAAPLPPTAQSRQVGAGTAADGALQRIAIVSCVDQKRPTHLLESIRQDNPGLVLFAGDNVYANQVPFALSHLDEAYRTLGADPNFARLRDAAPHMALWDDNDYGLNDGGAEFPAKQESKNYFLNFWRVPANDPRRSRDGVYHASVFGPPGKRVQVIMVDVRFNRSPWKRTDQRDAPGKERYVPDPNTANTMLGDAQWRWLEQQLMVPADVRVLVSGIQITTEGHGWERWGLMPHERNRLYGLIAKTQARGVVLLSGDRHIGAFYTERNNVPYVLTEMTSSGGTHVWDTANEAGPNRLGGLVRVLHFGTVEIDWLTRMVFLKLKDAQRNVVGQVNLSIDALAPGGTGPSPMVHIK